VSTIWTILRRHLRHRRREKRYREAQESENVARRMDAGRKGGFVVDVVALSLSSNIDLEAHLLSQGFCSPNRGLSIWCF
jgi:hypothetical protein